MAILVDYTCRSCGSREERWAPSPPPVSVSCSGCGAESRRAWAPIGLLRTAGSTESAVSASSDGSRRSICSQYPQIPGLCHMSDTAGRMWVAKYLKDGRAVDREHARQQKQAETKPPNMADAITHNHQPGVAAALCTSDTV